MCYPPDPLPAPACMSAPSPPCFVLLAYLSSTPPLSSSIGSLLESPPLIGSSSMLVSSQLVCLQVPRQGHDALSLVQPRAVCRPLVQFVHDPPYLSAVLGHLGARNSPAHLRTTPWSSRPCSRRSSTPPCSCTPGTHRQCSHRDAHLPPSSSRSPGTPGW